MSQKFAPETDENGIRNAEKAGTSIRGLFEETGVDYARIRMTVLVNSSRKDLDYIM